MSDGGKGSAPRKAQDQAAYAANWDTIFGRGKRERALQALVDDAESLGLYDPQQTENFRNPMNKETTGERA